MQLSSRIWRRLPCAGIAVCDIFEYRPERDTPPTSPHSHTQQRDSYRRSHNSGSDASCDDAAAATAPTPPPRGNRLWTSRAVRNGAPESARPPRNDRLCHGNAVEKNRPEKSRRGLFIDPVRHFNLPQESPSRACARTQVGATETVRSERNTGASSGRRKLPATPTAVRDDFRTV